MSPWIYLPVAGQSIPVLLIAGLGFGVGCLSGLFGVGGGFLLTPLLIMIGIPPTVAAASDANQIVAASASGAYAHARARTVDFKMGTLLLLGGVIGGTIGVQVVKLLRAAGEADFVIMVVYVVMLGGIGSYMFRDSLLELRGTRSVAVGEAVPAEASLMGRLTNALPFKLDFPRSGVRFSALLPLTLGILVGVLSALMGVGGGFIMVPIMVYLLRMPMHVVVGTSLFQICITCVNVTLQQAIYNHTVDLLLAVVLFLGSSIGAQIGTRLGRKLRSEQLKILMAVLILLTTIKLLLGLVLPPEVPIALAGGH
jgi:uncharacterized membrane protein YfcA